MPFTKSPFTSKTKSAELGQQPCAPHVSVPDFASLHPCVRPQLLSTSMQHQLDTPPGPATKALRDALCRVRTVLLLCCASVTPCSQEPGGSHMYFRTALCTVLLAP